MAGLLLASVSLAAEDGREELEEGPTLLGIFVRDVEKDAIDVLYENGKFLLPAEIIFSAINLRDREGPDGRFIDTPIGTLPVPDDILRDVEGVEYISEDFLTGKLNTRVSFDVETYAVVLEPPWASDAPLAEAEGAGVDPDVEPDAVPPIIGMTSAHGDLFTTYAGTADEVGVSARLELNGHALGGIWRTGILGTPDEYRIDDYAYLRELSSSLWGQVGRQRIGVHPLVSVVDMTGAQIAYSSDPKVFDEIFDLGGALVERSNGAARRFVGEGPAGGRVELVVDGLVVAEALIGVDGAYSIESPVFSQGLSEVEIRVFEALSENQVDSIRIPVSANEFLATQGLLTVTAAAGIEGDAFDAETRGSMTGGARIRYAPTDDLTLEAAASYSEAAGARAAVGAAIGLGSYGAAYAGVGAGEDGRLSAEAQYYGTFGRTTVSARLGYAESLPIVNLETGEEEDRDPILNNFAEIGHAYSDRLRFGVVARQNAEATYILPFLTWRPFERLTLSARPNRDGEYRLEARARPFANVDLQAFYEGGGFARVAYRFETEATGETDASLEALYDEDERGIGFAAGLGGERILGFDASWQVRAEQNEDSRTGSLGLRHELRPGVLVSAEAGFRQFDGGENELFGSLGLSFDIGLVGGRLAAAPRSGIYPRQGRIAGRLQPPGGVELLEGDLDGARVLVDERPLARVESDGSFYLPRVDTGIRTVRIEADRLPIDLVIDSDSLFAEIRAGAVTPVSFDLAVEVGAAGRVRGPDDEPVAGVPLEMVDADGKVRARTRSNQFGLFRLDGLRPGRYLLRAMDIWEGATREVEIGTEYRFGTDLKVSKPSKPAEPIDTVTDL